MRVVCGIFACAIVFGGYFVVWAASSEVKWNGEAGEPLHPRLFFDASFIPELQGRANKIPWKGAADRIWNPVDINTSDPYYPSLWLRLTAERALLSENNASDLCADAFNQFQWVVNDSGLWNNGSAEGLTRAYFATSAAFAYDFCWSYWDSWAQEWASYALLVNAVSLMFNFDEVNGYANNHEGVRFASAGISFAACDVQPACSQRGENAYDWVIGHLRANLGQQSDNSIARGWGCEGLGYVAYPWQFIGPFGIAAERLWGKRLVEDVPPAELVLWTQFFSAVRLPRAPQAVNIVSLGVHPDYEDDNPSVTEQGTLNLAFYYVPEEYHDGMLWMYNAYFGEGGDKVFDSARGGGLYGMLYLPEGEGRNPEEVWGLGYNDTFYKIALFRNGYFDGEGPIGEEGNWPRQRDVLAAHSARGRHPYQAHSGPDANSVRLLGQGSAWLTGGGRTGNPQGQCILFPSDPMNFTDGTDELGTFVRPPYFREDGSGVTVGEGSSVNVTNFVRRFAVDFGVKSFNLSAVVILADSSENGAVSRLSTPGFNSIITSPQNNTFQIRGPPYTSKSQDPSAILCGVNLHPPNPHLRQSSVPRGDPNDPHSGGFPFRTNVTRFNNVLDISPTSSFNGTTDGEFLTVLLLSDGPRSPSEPFPSVQVVSGTGCCNNVTIRIGNSRTYLVTHDNIEFQ